MPSELFPTAPVACLICWRNITLPYLRLFHFWYLVTERVESSTFYLTKSPALIDSLSILLLPADYPITPYNFTKETSYMNLLIDYLLFWNLRDLDLCCLLLYFLFNSNLRHNCYASLIYNLQVKSGTFFYISPFLWITHFMYCIFGHTGLWFGPACDIFNWLFFAGFGLYPMKLKFLISYSNQIHYFVLIKAIYIINNTRFILLRGYHTWL